MNTRENFVKLFDLNIPKIEYFDYYLDQMSKSKKYSDISNYYRLFESCNVDISDPYEYRRQKALEVTEFIQGTNAYNELCYDKNLIDYPTNKNIEFVEDINYLSIDLKSANWVALKSYDPEHINELGTNFNDFLSRFNLPQVFIESKYLRQFLFSKIDTKKIIKVQRNMIQEVVRKLQNELLVEGVRNDEVIFQFNDFSEVASIIDDIDQNKYKIKIFKSQKFDDFRLDCHYDIHGNLIHKELIGLDPSLFYINLKKYVTGEKIELKDLFFTSDGNLAVWCLDNLKLEYND